MEVKPQGNPGVTTGIPTATTLKGGCGFPPELCPDSAALLCFSCFPTLVQSKQELESEPQQRRYNLRRRKDEADGAAAEAKALQEVQQEQENDAHLSAGAAASPAPQLDFGGKLGRLFDAAGSRQPGRRADVIQLLVAAGGRAADLLREERCHAFSFAGACFWLLFLPAWVLFLILQVNLADTSLANFPPALPALATWWDAQALGFVVLWILFQALLYVLPVGKVSMGGGVKEGSSSCE